MLAIGGRAAAAALAAIVLAASLGGSAAAQTDEIQVYDASIAEPGKLDLTLHDNYTPKGRVQPAFPGAVVSDRSLNGVPEFAYGVAPWMEAGLYLPLYTLTRRGRFQLDGFKLRALFVEPGASERPVSWGVNFEFSVNAKSWEPSRFSGEIRPILALRRGPWSFVVNPILDTDYRGFARLSFAPETRLSYAVSKALTVAVETYDDYGELRALGGRGQTHQLFAVLDLLRGPVSIELGAGAGLSRASDRTTLKLILSRGF